MNSACEGVTMLGRLTLMKWRGWTSVGTWNSDESSLWGVTMLRRLTLMKWKGRTRVGTWNSNESSYGDQCRNLNSSESSLWGVIILRRLTLMKWRGWTRVGTWNSKGSRSVGSAPSSFSCLNNTGFEIECGNTCLTVVFFHAERDSTTWIYLRSAIFVSSFHVNKRIICHPL